MTFAELKKNIRKAKRVYVDSILTSHDPFPVQVVKSELLWLIKMHIEPVYKIKLKHKEVEIQANWHGSEFYFHGVFDIY